MGFKAVVSGLFSKRNAPPSTGAVVSFPAISPFSSRDISLNSTVQACGNIIANAVATMPLNMYFQNPKTGARSKAVRHPLYTIAKYRPNLEQTPVVFFGQGVRDILQKGNWYLWKVLVDGQIRAWIRLPPENVRERYEGETTIFICGGEEYRSGPDCPIFRITSLVVDDHGKGFSPLTFAKLAVQLGIQLDQYSLNSFANGPNTKLILDLADMLADMTDEKAIQAKIQEVAGYIARNYNGAENAGKPLILFKGMKASPITGISSNRDAELLESRKWQEQEICKIFNVPPFLVNSSYDVKYGGLEQAMTVFLNFGITPLLLHIAGRFNSLLTAYEQGAYYFEFDYSALLRADAKSRAEFYYKMLHMGAMSPDDIAERENLEPDPNGVGAMRWMEANLMPQRQDVQDAYMASAKETLANLKAGKPDPAAVDPALAAGSQAQ